MSGIRNGAKDEIVRIILHREYTGFSAYDLAKLADKILSIPKLAVVDRGAELPENPYHPNPLREYDHQITEAGRIGYAEAQQDMLKVGWVKEIKG